MMAQSPHSLWSAADAVAATGAEYTHDWHASGVSIDSRTVESGDLFVALHGPNFDGHRFIGDAMDRGAVAAMVGRSKEEIPDNVPLLRVPDTLLGLTGLGRAARRRSEAVVIGVTGSVGKTSVRYAIAELLGKQAPTAASVGSFNNYIGVPLSLARLPVDARYGVFELGMNHAGELRELARLARPKIAVITNVENTHLEFFDSVAEIAAAKSEIFEGVEPDGIAVLNQDNAHYEQLAVAARAAGIARIISFGFSPDADVRATDFTVDPSETRVTADVDGQIFSYVLHLSGRHWIMNSLAAMAAIMAANGNIDSAAEGLADLVAVQGRGAQAHIAAPGIDFELIDDAYNASPASMAAALEVLSQSRPAGDGRRIAILGDMFELGAMAADLHIQLAEKIEEAGIDLLFAVGPMMRHLFGAVRDGLRGEWHETADQLAAAIAAVPQDGDVVLVKGSAGMQMSQVVEALQALDQPTARAANGY